MLSHFRINLEQISRDIKDLEMQLEKNKILIEKIDDDESLKDQMRGFVQSANNKIKELNLAMEEVDAMRLKVADYFCEDATQFRLEECFKIFDSFCKNFSKCLKENEQRQQKEKKNLLRQQQKIEQGSVKIKSGKLMSIHSLK